MTQGVDSEFYKEKIMLFDGHWALEIAERLKVEMEIEYAHDDDLRTPDEWMTVMQEELEATKYVIQHKMETISTGKEYDDAN